MQSFRELKVWQKARQLALAIYQATATFPGSELSGLTSQMRRAVVSIGSYIAEGCGRDAGPDFARFLQIATGSASELEGHLLLARDLKFLSCDTVDRLTRDVIEVKRMLSALTRKVRASGTKPPLNQNAKRPTQKPKTED